MNFRLLARAVIGGIALLTILLLWPLQNLKFNYDIESFFSQSDPDLDYYLNYRETFENDNDFVLIGISNDEGIFNKDFLNDVSELTSNLKALGLITSVKSPTNLRKSIIGPLGGVLKVPLIHIDEPLRYDADKELIYSANDVYSSLFSQDTAKITILIKKVEFSTKATNDSLLLAIANLIEPFHFDEYHIAGRISTQNFYVAKMGAEMPLFGGITLLLMIIFLLFSFRCGLGVFIPITVLIVSLIWTFAVINLTGNRLDLMLTMLPALLFIIGISNSIHLITKYIDEVGMGRSDIDAMRTTIRETGFTTFLTSSTTAVGFFSLMLIEIEPIQRFGFFTGIGVLITYLISITLIPALLLNIKSHQISCSYQLKKGWDTLLRSVSDFSIANKRWIVAFTLLLFALALWGIKEIRFNNYFLDDISAESSLKSDLLYFEDNFSGIRPFEMGFHLVDTAGSIFQVNTLKEIEAVEEHLANEYGVGSIVSPLTIIKSANRAMHGGRNKYYSLPDTERELKKVMKLLQKHRALRDYSTLINSNENRGRITGRINDLGSVEIARINEDLVKFLSTHTSLNSYKITGAAQLMDNTNELIALNLVKGLGTALLFTAIILGMLFSSIRIALVSLIPNTLPLILIAGIMGWLGIDLKVATALVFPIAFGIAVDDTIHLLSRLRLENKAGVDWDKAIGNSIVKSGKAILITTLILSSGFLVFMLSDFTSTSSIGLLVSLALVFAVLADLLLLPILLHAFINQRK